MYDLNQFRNKVSLLGLIVKCNLDIISFLNQANENRKYGLNPVN